MLASQVKEEVSYSARQNIYGLLKLEISCLSDSEEEEK